MHDTGKLITRGWGAAAFLSCIVHTVDTLTLQDHMSISVGTICEGEKYTGKVQIGQKTYKQKVLLSHFRAEGLISLHPTSDCYDENDQNCGQMWYLIRQNRLQKQEHRRTTQECHHPQQITYAEAEQHYEDEADQVLGKHRDSKMQKSVPTSGSNSTSAPLKMPSGHRQGTKYHKAHLNNTIQAIKQGLLERNNRHKRVTIVVSTFMIQCLSFTVVTAVCAGRTCPKQTSYCTFCTNLFGPNFL